jgi:hypothetical protein
MAIYAISYDLRNRSRSDQYDALHEAIKRYTHYPVVESF